MRPPDTNAPGSCASPPTGRARGRVAIVAREALHWARLLHLTGDFTCVCACCTIEEASNALPDCCPPDIVLLDLDLAELPAAQQVDGLKRLVPGVPFVAVGDGIDPEIVLNAFRSGVVGFLPKETTPATLADALVEICSGGAPMPRHVARRLVESLQPDQSCPRQDFWHLSPRETEVLQLLSEGLSNRNISERLEICVDTVRAHLKHIFDKLNVRSRSQAVSQYFRSRASGTGLKTSPDFQDRSTEDTLQVPRNKS